jgi:uncharacterized membrane protein YbhN (UPF0104 family)
MVGLTAAVAAQWQAIESYDWRLAWLPFLAAVSLFVFGPLVGAVCFWLVVRDLTRRTRLVPALVVWGRSFAARLVPSGALTVAVRLCERDSIGASSAQVWTATVYEQLVSATAGATAAVVGLRLGQHRSPGVALALLVVAGGLLFSAAPLHRYCDRRGVLGRLVAVWQPARCRVLVAAVMLSFGGWLVAGVAAWLFARAVSTRAVPSLAFLVGAYAFAWLVGFVVPFVPSGLGVREVTLAAMLAPAFGPAGATALAVGLRLANVAGDLVAIGVLEAVRRSAPGRRLLAPTLLVSGAT